MLLLVKGIIKSLESSLESGRRLLSNGTPNLTACDSVSEGGLTDKVTGEETSYIIGDVCSDKVVHITGERVGNVSGLKGDLEYGRSYLTVALGSEALDECGSHLGILDICCDSVEGERVTHNGDVIFLVLVVLGAGKDYELGIAVVLCKHLVRYTCALHHKECSAFTERVLVLNVCGVDTEFTVKELGKLSNGINNALACKCGGLDDLTLSVTLTNGSAGAVEPRVNVDTGGDVTEGIAGVVVAVLYAVAVVLVNALAHLEELIVGPITGLNELLGILELILSEKIGVCVANGRQSLPNLANPASRKEIPFGISFLIVLI